MAKGKMTRGKRKSAGKGSPISLFVRNKISAKQYWEMTHQSMRSAIKED